MRKFFKTLALVSLIGLTVAALTGPVAAQRAVGCGSNSDHDAVIAACTQIIARGNQVPTQELAKAYHRRASLYYIKIDYDRAMRDIDEAIRLEPNNSLYYAQRADIFVGKDDGDRAIRDYDAAIRLDSRGLDLATSHRGRGRAYFLKGDLDRALHDLDESLRRHGGDQFAYLDRGYLYVMKGDHARALTDFDEADRVSQQMIQRFMGAPLATTGPGYVGRSLAYRRMGSFDRALRELDDVILRNPNWPNAYFQRGLTYLAQGDNERARLDMRKTLELSPNYNSEFNHDSIYDREFRTPREVLEKIRSAILPANRPAATGLPPSASSRPASEKRIALVIGNGAYANVPALANPTNDARTVAESFRSVGFTSVRSETNLKRDALVNALKAFAAEAENADWAVVYFAGHGIEFGGANWLIPVDAALKTDRDVQYEAVPLDQVVGSVEGARKLGIIILDACRDNPFAAKMRSTSAGRSIGRGLASVEPRRGTLVAFAAKHGQIALDGDADNSPFVSALVRRIHTPGIEVNMLFRHVRDDVLTVTNNRQEPFVYGALPAQDFYFTSR